MHKLTINLVVYNGEKYIPYLLESLKKQTFKDFEMIVIDNASTDKTVEFVEAGLKDSGVEYRLIKNSENVGFSAGHNQALKEVQTPYFLLQNADMYLMPDVLEKLVVFLDNHPETAAIAPRLMRWDFGRVQAATQIGPGVAEAAREGFTSQIDAIGMKLFRNRRAVEWLTRQEWAKDSESQEVRSLYNKPVQEVFGVSGAFSMYRKTIIEKVLLPGDNLFDPTYHSYKEDLDLAYRLRNAGFVSYVLLDAVSYHDRTGAGPKEMGDWSAIMNKKRQPYFVSYHSYKNHLRTLYKNEYWQNLLLDFVAIFWYELKKFGFLLATNPKVVFNGWIDIIRNWSYTRSARAAVVASRKMYWKGIRRWF